MLINLDWFVLILHFKETADAEKSEAGAILKKFENVSWVTVGVDRSRCFFISHGYMRKIS